MTEQESDTVKTVDYSTGCMIRSQIIITVKYGKRYLKVGIRYGIIPLNVIQNEKLCERAVICFSDTGLSGAETKVSTHLTVCVQK